MSPGGRARAGVVVTVTVGGRRSERETKCWSSLDLAGGGGGGRRLQRAAHGVDLGDGEAPCETGWPNRRPGAEPRARSRSPLERTACWAESSRRLPASRRRAGRNARRCATRHDEALDVGGGYAEKLIWARWEASAESGAGETLRTPPASARDTFSVRGTQPGAVAAAARTSVRAPPIRAAPAPPPAGSAPTAWRTRSNNTRLNRR